MIQQSTPESDRTEQLLEELLTLEGFKRVGPYGARTSGWDVTRSQRPGYGGALSYFAFSEQPRDVYKEIAEQVVRWREHTDPNGICIEPQPKNPKYVYAEFTERAARDIVTWLRARRAQPVEEQTEDAGVAMTAYMLLQADDRNQANGLYLRERIRQLRAAMEPLAESAELIQEAIDSDNRQRGKVKERNRLTALRDALASMVETK